MSLFASPNQGFIIMAIIGLLLMLLAIMTGLAPDLIKRESATFPPLLRIPIVGFFLSCIGVGSVPILFLLGVYPFMVGIVGWSGNLWWYWYHGFYPSSTEVSWLKAIGFMLARLLIALFAQIKPLLKTQTKAQHLTPERLIGSKGKVLSVLGDELMEVNVYDTVGKYYVQIYALPWEKASDRQFQVGEEVYILGLVAPRRYAVVKADSYDELKAIRGNGPL